MVGGFRLWEAWGWGTSGGGGVGRAGSGKVGGCGCRFLPTTAVATRCTRGFRSLPAGTPRDSGCTHVGYQQHVTFHCRRALVGRQLGTQDVTPSRPRSYSLYSSELLSPWLVLPSTPWGRAEHFLDTWPHRWQRNHRRCQYHLFSYSSQIPDTSIN